MVAILPQTTFEETTMSRFSFRPQLESLEERALPSAITINDVANVDRIGAQTAFVFTVGLSQPSNRPVSVKYTTADGTATAAEGDYVPIAGTLNFAKGQTAATVTVLVNGATVVEPDETFLVKLSGASHATIADGAGVGTIQEPPPPQALDDSSSTYQYRAVSGNVLANDSEPAGGGLTVGTVNGTAANVGTTIHLASGALLTVNADGSYTYDPNGAFNYLASGQSATESFTYTATDALGTRSNTATVSITISHPVLTAVDDSATILYSSSSSGNVLANDVDPTGGGLTVTTVNDSAANVGATIQLPSGALLTVYANGYYAYDPNGAFNYLAGTGLDALDTFTYTVTDSLGNQSNTATVSITIYGDGWSAYG
jgi:VCBS repeat-containing protein